MAESKIPTNVLDTPKALADFTQMTLLNGTHYLQGCKYIKLGCFVYVAISVVFNSAPSNVHIFTMPSGYIPANNGVEVTVSGGASYNAKAQCQIDNTGKIRVSSVDKWVTGSGIFVVQA